MFGTHGTVQSQEHDGASGPEGWAGAIVAGDPIVAARSKFIDENGGKSFFDYSVPQAVITLKQGIGRLIRSKTDRGVIAILDPRLRTKSYGRDFLNSLPRMRITADLNDVAAIFTDFPDGAI